MTKASESHATGRAALAALILSAALMSAPSAEEGAPSVPAAPPAIGDPARLFSSPDLTGRSVDAADYLRGRVGLLTFWASWCQPCLSEIPHLRDLNIKYRAQGLALLGIGVREGGDTADQQRHLAGRKLINYLLLFDADRRFEAAYQLKGVPHNVLIGRDGRIRWQGSVLPEDIESRIQNLLAENAPTGGQG